ncbi:DUF4245 domain-containing protein [Arthrobacter sp. RIT-PI-e]|uniref:DUF4245 domain-containing protein n=1 Tax=Arthrobacter sp. RIT-PI-e TaxID=1681197 RepID=UPI001F4070F2|nr:DUF4245 domain-containing protein [Arthrobacter sp. RIT-PI-e]
MSDQGDERSPSTPRDSPADGRPVPGGADGRAGERAAAEARLRAELYDDAPPISLTANQAKRLSATARGMLLATGATLAVVLPVYFLNPTHTAETYRQDIDVANVARQAAGDAGYLPAAPELPEGWSSNYARWNTGSSDGVAFWEVGYLTGDDGFIELTQTDRANPTWEARRIGSAQVSGSRTIGGEDWELLDASNGDTVLRTDLDGATIILKGPAELTDFDTLGEAVTQEVAQNAVDEAERLSSDGAGG